MWNLSSLETLLPERLQWLPLNIALIDANGTIRQVNERWRTFGQLNGLRLPESGLGSNYFDFCAPDLLNNLMQLVSCTRFCLSFLYPCRSAERDLWMVQVALSLGFEPPAGLLVWHYDITNLLPADIVQEGILPAATKSQANTLLKIVEQATLNAVSTER
jgi:hypothetical protein